MGPFCKDFGSFLGRSWAHFGSIWSHVGPFGDHPGGRRYKNTGARIRIPVFFLNLIKRLREAKNIKQNLGFLMILAFPPLDILSRQKTPPTAGGCPRFDPRGRGRGRGKPIPEGEQ